MNVSVLVTIFSLLHLLRKTKAIVTYREPRPSIPYQHGDQVT